MDWQEKVEYALVHTRVLLYPQRKLETFGSTVVHYYVLSELLDRVGEVRIREGRVMAERPRIITPHYVQHTLLESFGEEARDYMQWLKDYADGLRFLEYGYRFRKEFWSQHAVSGSLGDIADTIQKRVAANQDHLTGIVMAVDDLWEISLVKLLTDITRASLEKNVRDLADQRLFELEGGVPRRVRQEIEESFRRAEQGSLAIRELGSLLQQQGLLDEYQDRFFQLVGRSRRSGG